MKRKSLREIEAFICSGKTDQIVDIFRPKKFCGRLRLIRTTIRGKPFYFATTLLDPIRYPASAISQLYRERWQIEVAFKHCKRSLGLENLRAETAPTLKQEIGSVFLAFQLLRISEFKRANRRPESFKHLAGILGSQITFYSDWDISRTRLLYSQPIPWRPDRVFLRISKKPINRWQRSIDKEWRRQKRQLLREQSG